MLVGENAAITRIAKRPSLAWQKRDRCHDWIHGFKLAPLVNIIFYARGNVIFDEFNIFHFIFRGCRVHGAFARGIGLFSS